MTLDFWLAKHPYLEPMARLDADVDSEIDGIALSTAGIPDWNAYLPDYVGGVPLLESPSVAIDLEPVEKALAVVAGRLASRSLPGALRTEAAALGAGFRSASDANSRSLPHESSGLRRYLIWRLLSRYLCPVVDAFAAWRQEESWLRHYCPICGSAPSMAQLVGVDSGLLRLLACGCCGYRWRYLRTGCPFCRNEDGHRLGVIAVEGEEGLRIDYCEQCGGYLKTYQGQGSEMILLADWTSLQLDIVALHRGLKRVAASIYEV